MIMVMIMIMVIDTEMVKVMVMVMFFIIIFAVYNAAIMVCSQRLPPPTTNTIACE